LIKGIISRRRAQILSFFSSFLVFSWKIIPYTHKRRLPKGSLQFPPPNGLSFVLLLTKPFLSANFQSASQSKIFHTDKLQLRRITTAERFFTVPTAKCFPCVKGDRKRSLSFLAHTATEHALLSSALQLFTFSILSHKTEKYNQSTPKNTLPFLQASLPQK
jgi:hypothetical protein